MLPEQQRILGYFIEEAAEHLQTIERGLLNLQATIDDTEFANEIFRAAHSVKGGAAMLGLGSIAAISHRLEDYFKLLKDQPIVVNNQVESQFLLILDALQDQVGELQRTADPSSLDEASVLADLDPVFHDLKAQLNQLANEAPAAQRDPSTGRDQTLAELRSIEAESSAPMTLPLSQPSEEQSALQLIFHTDVLARLRDILRLFQQPETPETRQKICDLCRVLAKVGDQFELPQWRHLLDVTHEAISLPHNRFSDLAAVAIKELKQAQELVLADRESEIAISAALQALLPLSPDSLLFDHEADADLDSEFDDLFNMVESDSSGAEDEHDDDLFAEAHAFDASVAAKVAPAESVSATKHPGKDKRHGPEVGSAELSSLADLFETGMDDLESWDSLDRAEGSRHNPLGDPDAEELDGDFADLFASDDTDSPIADREDADAADDLDSLFDDIADATDDDIPELLTSTKTLDAERSRAISDPDHTSATPSHEATATNDGDDLDDLFDLLDRSDLESETTDPIDSEGDDGLGLELSLDPDLDLELDLDNFDLADLGLESDDAHDAKPAIATEPEELAPIDALDFDLDLDSDLLDLAPDFPFDTTEEPESSGGLADLEDLFDPSDHDSDGPLHGLNSGIKPVSSDADHAVQGSRTSELAADHSEDFDGFDDFDDLFGDLETVDRDRNASITAQVPSDGASSDFSDFDDDFDLFDLNVGEAETFAPPQTKPPILDDDDLSLDDLFDAADNFANPSAFPAIDHSESETAGTEEDFDDLFAGLDLSEVDDSFDSLEDLDDLDLSEALADVSLELDSALDLTDRATDEDDAGDSRLFPHLSIWLNLPETDIGADVFEVLEAYLAQPLGANVTPALAADANRDFADLEHLLEVDAPPSPGGAKLTADRALPVTNTTRSSNRRQRGRGSAFEQTMRVPIKRLDDLSNLVGELVVNRNSLEDDQERLRQFLDNLLHQVSQLSEVGQRMQDLYERTLLEMALLASRKNRTLAAQGGIGNSNDEGDEDFDALEMDKFSLFHLQAQEIIELVVRVRESSSDIEFLVDENDQVTRQLRQVTTQLQEGLNRSRMVAFSNATDRLLRGVRDNAIKFGKQVNLQIEGRDMLIDRMILEHLYDPLTHLVNNAIAHGVETPEERIAKGKPPEGTITVSSFNQGNQTIIAISDDGAGIDKARVASKAVQKGLISQEQADNLTDPEIYDLLFLPNFSTRDMADDLAGRGVGMDVVKTKLNEIRGVIVTDSTRDQGTTFTIRLPLTLSISKALCCISDHAPIAFPMDGVSEVLDNLPSDRIIREDDDTAYVQWREQKVPYQPLSSLFNYSRLSIRPQMYGSTSDDDTVSVVILRSAGSQLAISVDSIVGEQEIVIKQLEGPIPKPVGITGATVMGDGHIVPIADVLELIDLSLGRVRRDASSLWDETEEATVVQVEKAEPMVLIIDDSITVRELLSMTFKKSGYRVEQARDGQEAWEKMRSGMPCELVFCDMEMPRMNGMELLEKMSADPRLSELPIAMLTSRTAEKMKRRAGELGAKGYFTKPYLEEVLLDAAQRMLAGENLMASTSNAEPASAS
ncbi:MAG: hybrid sensor histidine kinase/response regulator [Oscillatoriales cyanobacterium]|nr:MAG: hybrid sensor histidine kinase/response regulator [Oscillatoriales cyanobacterium]